MANGKIRFGKQSGGTLGLVFPDGIGNTEVMLPESGELATKDYVDGKYSGFKNYIINGKKAVNQRGLTSTDNSYNQDRWYKAGNNWYQGIEGINLVSGKKYTLSWVGTATASYYVGTATRATINAQSFIAIANGGNFTLTISAGQNLWIKFASDLTGSTFNFVQLEEGSVATPFEQRPYGVELSFCERYYQTIDFMGHTGIGVVKSHAGGNGAINIKLHKNMRVSPGVIVFIDPLAGGYFWVSGGGTFYNVMGGYEPSLNTINLVLDFSNALQDYAAVVCAYVSIKCDSDL